MKSRFLSGTLLAIVAFLTLLVFSCDSFLNTPPSADAGPDQQVALGTEVQLDGTGSMDPDGNTLTYSWTLNSYPTASRLRDDDISGSGNTIAYVTPDEVGDYIFDLAVFDGVDSVTDSVKITVTESGQSGAPQAPTGLTISSETESTLTITWNASSGATSYKLFRDGGATAIYTGSGTSYTDTGLVASTAYSYKVLASNAAGSSSLSAAQIGNTAPPAPTPPPTPTGLATSNATVSTIDISWNAAATATSYNLYRNGDPIFTDTVLGAVKKQLPGFS